MSVASARRRFVVYAVIGWSGELAFTAVVDRLGSRGPRFPRLPSLWMLPVYGLMQPLFEPVHDALRERLSPVARGAVYAAGFWTVEYLTGRLLRRVLGEAPWDYSHAPLHLHGLIRGDYLPLWGAVGLGMENVHDRLVGRGA